MKILAFIPARFASTRFPGKVLVNIQGKPMLQHVIEHCQKAQCFDDLYVAVDHPRVQDLVESLGVKAIMTHPDCPSGTDRIAEAANLLGLNDDNLIVNVQGDQPTIDPRMLEALVKPFVSAEYDGSFQMATLKKAINDPKELHNPNVVKVITNHQDFAIYFSRATIPWGRDDWDHVTYKHIGTYAYTLGFIRQLQQLPVSRLEKIEKLEQLRVIDAGFPIKVVESFWDIWDVNAPEDLLGLANP